MQILNNVGFRKIKNHLCTETFLLRSIHFIAFTLLANSSRLLWVDFEVQPSFWFSPICFGFMLGMKISWKMYLFLHSTKYWRLDILPEVWAFPRPSEEIFSINRPLRAPRKLSWVCIIEMSIKKVKTPFYQPSSFYLEMIIAHNTKQPKFPRCRCLSMFRRLPSIIPRVHCKLKRITRQLSETQGRHRLE